MVFLLYCICIFIFFLFLFFSLYFLFFFIFSPVVFLHSSPLMPVHTFVRKRDKPTALKCRSTHHQFPARDQCAEVENTFIRSDPPPTSRMSPTLSFLFAMRMSGPHSMGGRFMFWGFTNFSHTTDKHASLSIIIQTSFPFTQI